MVKSDDNASFVLTLLGPPGLTSAAGEPVASLGPGKSLGMLAYLVVRGQARREELIELLWGDMPDAKARNAFRQSLHRLRTALGEDILPQDRDRVGIGDSSLVRVDRDRFLHACDDQQWANAIELYGGDFLEGFELAEPSFDRWADAERVRLRAKFQTALRSAARQAQDAGELGQAAQHAQRLAATAPYDEDAALFEAGLLVSAGRSTEALAASRAFSERLRRDLDLPTPAGIQNLLNRLERSAKTGNGGDPAVAARASTRAPQPPFFGRESELARLLSALGDLKAEHGSTFIISGEAGIGKTRLLDEFVERARTLGGVQLLRGRERAATSSLPYAGIAEALRQIVRAPGISGASRHLLAEASRLLPELRDSFDLPPVSPIEDEAGRFAFFEGIAAVIDAAAYERPLCIVVDDAQHASNASLDLLSYLAGRLRTSPVLIVIAMRSERGARSAIDRLRALARSEADGASGDVVLAPLTRGETSSLVRASLRTFESSDGAIDRIVDQSAGRPFLALELAARLRDGLPPTETLVSMSDLLWARLQSASPSQRRVFFAAALLERPASLRLLAAASHLPETTTLDAADALTRAGLLREMGSGYATAHDSTAHFVVDSSGLAGRALLAGWAADALSQEDDRTDAELAGLYALAGRASLAFTHARAGALAAGAVGAVSEATRLLTMALTFAPDERSRDDIESLLAAYGPGSLRLPGAVADIDVDTEDADLDLEETVTEGAERVVSEDAAVATTIPHQPPTAASHRRTPSAREWYMAIAVSVIIALLGVILRRQTTSRVVPSPDMDSLIVVQHDGRGQFTRRIAAIGSDESAPSLTASASPLAPAWADSISAPWADARISPDRRLVALARVTPHGKDVFILSADRRDTLSVVNGGGDNAALDWSPDSRILLVARARTLADGSYHSDLFAYPATRNAPPIAVDTNVTRSVTEAKWSPDGSSIAWVARGTASRRLDIFVSRADASSARQIAPSDGEDFGLAWSPDASLLTFTSTRSGAPRLYTYDFEHNKLWAASDRDGEDHALFSPDGRLIAFESTRDGDAAIYVRPPLGGRVRRVTPPGGQYSIGAWTGQRPRYIDRLRIVGNSAVTIGDSVRVSLLGVDGNGVAVPGVTAEWSVVSAPGIVRVMGDAGNAVRPDATPRHPERSEGSAFQDLSRTLIGVGEGTATIIASIPGWRADTLALTVGAAGEFRLEEDFSRGLEPGRWAVFGEPVPAVGNDPARGTTKALFPNGDFEWQSGILSRETFELRPGFVLRARVHGPFGGRPSPASVVIGLVPRASTIDPRAPNVEPTVAVSWDGQSGAFSYAVGREASTDRAPASRDSLGHVVTVRLGGDGTVVFAVDGEPRWHVNLRVAGDLSGSRFQLWIGSRATGRAVAISDVSLRSGRQ